MARSMTFTIHHREWRALLKSWAAISLAFAIFLTFNNNTIFSQMNAWARFLLLTLVSAATVGLGFLIHELAHKYIAEREGCHAEYQANDAMLLTALLLSKWFIFAAPGAVHISGRPNPRERGTIALAGPVANLVLALLFLILFVSLNSSLRMVMGFGGAINALMALFNLIPAGAFDGFKILSWSKLAYGLTVTAAVILSFLLFPLGLF